MAKNQPTPTRGGSPSASRAAAAKAGGRKAQAGRARNAGPVKKPFPWGSVAGGLAVVLVLGGVITYAAVNRGSEANTALNIADKKVPGVIKTDGLARNHVATAVTYPNAATTPPDGGQHNPVWQNCAVYTSALANEHAVHSLEHGAVWVTYNPDTASKADIAALTTDVTGDDYRMLSPYPGLKSPISLQAWGRQVFADKASDPQVKDFLAAYTQGPQAPEPGSACVGGVSTPGPFDASTGS